MRDIETLGDQEGSGRRAVARKRLALHEAAAAKRRGKLERQLGMADEFIRRSVPWSGGN